MAVATEQLTLFYLAADGLVRGRVSDRLDGLDVLGVDLEGETLREICQDPLEPRRLYAASTTDVYLSEDGGATWDQLSAGGIDFREIWTLAVHPTRAGEVYVGTMPAALYVSENGARAFRELPTFRGLPDYGRWTFPPAPHTAHIRCIALDARVPDEILVGVEEGGVARSRDRGASWQDVSGPPSDSAYPATKDLTGGTPYRGGQVEAGRVYRDVHGVYRHPTRHDTYYATSGLGTYRTDDAGATWTFLTEGLPVTYSLHLVGHATQPDRLFLGAAGNNPPGWKGFRPARGGPFASSRYRLDLSAKLGGAKSVLYRSDDAGASWQQLTGGLPVEHPYVVCSLQLHPRDPNGVFVGYADGSVYASEDAGESWRCISAAYPKVLGMRAFAGC